MKSLVRERCAHSWRRLGRPGAGPQRASAQAETPGDHNRQSAGSQHDPCNRIARPTGARSLHARYRQRVPRGRREPPDGRDRGDGARRLTRRFPRLASVLRCDGGLWVAWPKRTAGVATDLCENDVAHGRARRRTGRQQSVRGRRRVVELAIRLPLVRPTGGAAPAARARERSVPIGSIGVCGRYVSVSSPTLLAERLHVDEVRADETEPNYNVTPAPRCRSLRKRRTTSGSSTGFAGAWCPPGPRISRWATGSSTPARKASRRSRRTAVRSRSGAA